MGLSDKFYCFYQLSTLTEVEQAHNILIQVLSKYIYPCCCLCTKFSNRFATIRIQDKSWKRLSSLSHMVWSWLEYSKSWSQNKINPERSVIQIRKKFCLHRWGSQVKMPVFESNCSLLLWAFGNISHKKGQASYESFRWNLRKVEKRNNIFLCSIFLSFRINVYLILRQAPRKP